METMTPEVMQKTEREGTNAVEMAQELVITEPADSAVADQMLLDVSRYETRVALTFKPMKQRTHEAHKEVCDTEKKLLAPAKQAKAILKQKIGDYADEQERLQRIEADRIRAESEKQAREEAEAERERLAEAAADADDEEAFEEILEQPLEVAPVAPPPVAPAVPKTKGVTHSKVWTFEVTDPKKIPREYLMIDKVKIARVVKALKEDANIAGIRAYPKRQIGARG